ncbi:MFS transporter [Sphingomonas flavalba]|uniref:MFS transporter n=1 Tax=Sphingomonas flavalba TaxID=2559804 RepID=UPI0039E03CDB
MDDTRNYRIALAALLLAEMTFAFEIATIYAAQRALIEELRDPVLFGWLVTCPMIIGAALSAVIGRLGDLYGRRNLLIAVMLIGSVGSVAAFVSENYAMLLAGRTLQGFTHGVLPLAVGLVREQFPKNRVSMSIGLIASSATAGSAAGLVLGGLLVDTFSWRAIFAASAIFGVVASAAVLATFPKPSPVKRMETRIDWFSGLLFAPGIILVLLAISNIPRWGIADWKTIASAVSGVVLVTWWTLSSLRSPNPLISVRLLGIREFLFANLSFAMITMGALQLILVFSLLLQAPTWTGIGLGVSATVAGLVKLPSNVTSLTSGPFGAWLIDRFGARAAMMTGAAISMVGWILAIFFHDGVLQVGAVLILISFGSTMMFAVLPMIVAKVVPLDRTSEAIGVSAVIRGMAMGIGVQIISVLLASSTATGPGGTSFPTQEAFLMTFVVIAGMCAIAILAALPLSKRAAPTPAAA